MDIKIGNGIYLLLFLIVAPLWAADNRVELFLTDFNRRHVDHAEVGESLLLKMKISGDVEALPTSIPGIEKMQYEPREATRIIHSINGVATKAIEQDYLVRPTKTGMFTLGPVQVQTAHGTMSSNVVTLRVDAASAKQMSANDDFFLEVVPEKTTVYLGETIGLTMRLYARNNARVAQWPLPEIDASLATVTEPTQSRDGTKSIQGKEFRFVELQASITPKKVGTLIIPPTTCVVLVQDSSHGSAFGAMFFSMGFGSLEKHIRSQQGSINVEALPPYHVQPHAIGQYRTIAAQIDKKRIKEGDACLLTITIQGKGTLQETHPFGLDLPDAVRWFESKVETKNKNADGQTSIYEFVVQGLKAGTHTIPAQKFVFFNPHDKRYGVLATDALSLIVEPSMHKKSAPQQNHEKDTVHAQSDDKDALAPIVTDGPWQYQKSVALSLFWLLLLALLPWVLVGAYYLYTLRKPRIKNCHTAYKATVEQLKLCERTQRVAGLYDIFIEFFVHYCKQERSKLNDESIKQILQNAGFAAQTIEQWDRFFKEITHYAFIKDAKPDDATALFKRAHLWVQQLQDRL